MSSIRGRNQPAQRGQISEAPTSPLLSNKSDNEDHKDLLRSNKLECSKASVGPKALLGPEIPTGLEAPSRPPQAPSLPVSQDLSANGYSQ